MATENKKTKPKKRRQDTPFSALTDEDSLLGPNFLRKIGRGVSDWVEGEFGPRNAPPESIEPLEGGSNLPSGASADDTEENIVAAQRQIAILADPTFTESDRRKVANNLSSVSFDVLSKAAAGAGLDVQDVLASMDQLAPKSANQVLLTQQGRPVAANVNQPSPQEVLADQVAAVVNDTPAPKPGKSQREQDIDALRSRQAQFPTGENIAREAARNRPLDSFTRAEQFLEDMDSIGGPVRGPEDVRAPKATYVSAGKPTGPGGKVAGTQEDFESYRAQKAIDDAVAERRRQQRIKFLRAGGRMTADGKNIAVLPGEARKAREESRLAENQRNRESSEKFQNRLETDRIRKAEAEEFLKNIKRAARGADRTARGIASGGRRGSEYGGGAAEFFEEADQLGSVRAQLRGKDQESQVKWARKQLDNRERKRLEEEEQERERQRRMSNATSSYMDLANKNRSNPMSTINFGI